MKRRNFLSGLMAAPLALKARLARFFVPTRCVEPCGAVLCGTPTIFFTARQQQFFQLVNQGFSATEAFDMLKEASPTPPISSVLPKSRKTAFHGPRCSRPLGHKGPHMLLNPR
jgi:hypothetical protein